MVKMCAGILDSNQGLDTLIWIQFSFLRPDPDPRLGVYEDFFLYETIFTLFQLEKTEYR